MAAEALRKLRRWRLTRGWLVSCFAHSAHMSVSFKAAFAKRTLERAEDSKRRGYPEATGGETRLVGSHQTLRCRFKADAGWTQNYTGAINRVGIDLAIATAGIMSWLVMSKTSAILHEALTGKNCQRKRRCVTWSWLGRKCSRGRNMEVRFVAAAFGGGPSWPQSRADCCGHDTPAVSLTTKSGQVIPPDDRLRPVRHIDSIGSRRTEIIQGENE
jgi:hypothetical protein